MQPIIREATKADIPELLDMIRALADFHDEAERVTVTEEQLEQEIFASRPSMNVHVVEAPEESEFRLNGFSLWFASVASWEGGRVMHLEDLYVRPESRGTGAGKALLRNLAKIAKERGYLRIEWMVLKTNESGAAFYKSQGAGPMSDWDIFKLDAEAIDALA